MFSQRMWIGSKQLTRKQKRLAVIAGLGAVLAIAATLIFVALRDPDRVLLFAQRSEGAGHHRGHADPAGRVGEEGTLDEKDGETSDFVVTDGQTEMTAHYVGLLPDLFREGAGHW